ncbi:hypothetical protein FSC37_05350 [Piscinibacter aquaticus]|uniref:RapA2 cadherin-like domain-containing protein n=1 Tax=Piscinibacter aquaticus TaxID=392597 RepID=A0A5C6TYF0_9BURK|nr:hypothetical protein FSC37_05350 [Piscinibacter aquaticus]
MQRPTQALPGSAAPTENFTVTTLGTTRVITVTVAGANDAAAIGGTAAGSITEDTSVVAGNLSTGGTLTVSDVDAGRACSSRRRRPRAATAPSRWPPTARGPTPPRTRTPRSRTWARVSRSPTPSRCARPTAPRRASWSRSTARTTWR